MSKNTKSSLQKALLEVREIEDAALEGAAKIAEEKVLSKIEETVKETIQQIEKDSLIESVSIDVGDADVSINVEDGITSIDVNVDEEDLIITQKEDEEEISDDEISDEDSDEDSDDEISDEDSDEDAEDAEDSDDEDIFEVSGIYEEEDVEAPAEDMEAPAEDMEAPAEEAPAEEAPAEEEDVNMEDSEESMTVEVPTSSAIESLSNKLDMVLSKLEQPEADAEEANAEEAPAKEGDLEDTVSPDGEIEIVDDEIEIVDDEVEAPEDESSDEMIAEILDELEFMEEDDAIEETRGANHASKRTGNRTLKMNKDAHIAPVSSLSENKTHKEARLVELKKENGSLKKSLKEYKESFKVLRKQINEVQVFNAKLAYVNKLFSKGGLTNDEKVQIAENFDGTNTVEEAKILYNKIIGENKTITESKTEQLKSKLKSNNTSIVNSTKSETLYESTEISRMKQLAGIKTLND